jgi:hypothetical protein
VDAFIDVGSLCRDVVQAQEELEDEQGQDDDQPQPFRKHDGKLSRPALKHRGENTKLAEAGHVPAASSVYNSVIS